MSRDLGFTRADVDVGLFDDPKIRRLWRHLRGDKAAMNEAVVTYLAVVLASWDAVERVAVEDVLPVWLDRAELAPLVEVGLLDPDGRLPTHAFDAWLGPAMERRLKGWRRSAFGGFRSNGMSIEEANKAADASIANLRASFRGAPFKLDLEALAHTNPSHAIPSHPTPGMEDGMDGARAGATPWEASAHAGAQLNGQAEAKRPSSPSMEGRPSTVVPNADAPPKVAPPLDMARLHTVPMSVLETALSPIGLPEGDGRRYRIRAEIARRRAVEEPSSVELA